MKGIRKTFGLLLLGILAAAAVTLLLSARGDYKDWAYHYFREDYTKVGWVFDRAISVTRPIDNLFMGSSHILNGLDDRQIAQHFGTPDAAYNAGIPTSARNLQYVVIRDILQRNVPRRLFLELRETEERTSHFGFPIVASEGDVLSAPLNPWWIRDFVSMLQHRFAYIVSWLPLQASAQPVLAPEFGYLKNEHQISRDVLAQQARAAPLDKKWRWLPPAFGDLEFRSNTIYVEWIANLCREKGVELHFLYLPFVGAPKEPVNAAFYRTLGTLHLVPEQMAANIDYWADVTHFNPEGAAFYTKHLIETALNDQSTPANQRETLPKRSR